ncbi:unnamed protein product [Protopolystoma xenopodis]|uniref:Uncharacterized protein n=1 Tax=Protopolystoma xenopodis TaxID=117903 RepID=A0A3S4ZZ18_9PLAT|nr:unnamed protein product [Protopolystoma xenopodis]
MVTDDDERRVYDKSPSFTPFWCELDLSVNWLIPSAACTYRQTSSTAPIDSKEESSLWHPSQGNFRVPERTISSHLHTFAHRK